MVAHAFDHRLSAATEEMSPLSIAGDSRRLATDYMRTLIDGEIICDASYGKGFHLIRGWGLRLLRRMTDLFIEHIKDEGPIMVNRPSMLLATDQYEEQISEIGRFDNIYKVVTDQGVMVVRPDAAISNLSALMRSISSGGSDQIMACFQGFRNVRGSTLPLFRDRYIWPFVQFNQMVAASELPKATDQACRRIVAFFDSLCLPVRVVDLGPWKKYARRLYCAVAHMPDGKPTIVAMFFVVGDSYRRQCGIPENLEAFDIGVTEKVLALIAMRHADKAGLRLPSALTPTQVVLTEQAAAALQTSTRDLWLDGLRVEICRDSDSAVAVWRRRGVPLQVHRGRRGLRVYRRCQGWVDLGEQAAASEELSREDEKLWDAVSAHDLKFASPSYTDVESFTRSDGQAETVCLSARMAERLGSNASRSFPLSAAQFY